MDVVVLRYRETVTIGVVGIQRQKSDVFGVLHKHSADATRSDTQWGSKPPQIQVGAFKLHQIRCISRGVLSLLM